MRVSRALLASALLAIGCSGCATTPKTGRGHAAAPRAAGALRPTPSPPPLGTASRAVEARRRVFGDYDDDDILGSGSDADHDDEPAPKDRDNDTDSRTSSFYDRDDGPIRGFGQLASPVDRRA